MEAPLAAAARVCESGRERELDLLEIGKETETEFVMRRTDSGKMALRTYCCNDHLLAPIFRWRARRESSCSQ